MAVSTRPIRGTPHLPRTPSYSSCVAGVKPRTGETRKHEVVSTRD